MRYWPNSGGNVNSRKVALTGATGFIGSHLSRHLPYSLTRLVRAESQRKTSADVVGNLRAGEDGRLFARRYSQGCDTLLHLASSVMSPRSPIDHITQDLTDNLLASIDLFEGYALANPEGHIVFASSGGSVYEVTNAESLTELSPTKPTTHYGIVKLTIERYLEVLSAHRSVRVTVLRIGNPYGYLQPPERAQGLIGVGMHCLVHKKPFPIFGNPDYMLNTVRDYIHLSDITSAVTAAVERQQGSKYEIFNIGTGHGYANTEVLELMEQVAGRKIATELREGKMPDRSRVVLDISKARRMLSFEPRLSLAEGIRLMWNDVIKKDRTF